MTKAIDIPNRTNEILIMFFFLCFLPILNGGGFFRQGQKVLVQSFICQENEWKILVRVLFYG